jgi:hypothetical protein
LLFLVKPRVNPGAITQFGPWAYRGNAASYFNLLWPVCLGFWWTLNGARAGSAHHLLLLCAAAMAACPIISTSRGGALVTIAMLAAGVALVVGTELRSSRWGLRQGKQQVLTIGLIFLFAVSALGLGLATGWKSLRPRMEVLAENLQLREAMFDSARPMARDYPVFGTGPGTFTTVFQLYRISTQAYYPAQLHNDWLETRITFGWVGSGLIALAGLVILARWFIPGGVYSGPRFMLLTWLALGGCLLHARWDFPFQIYSIVFLVVVLCSMLFCFSRKPL